MDLQRLKREIDALGRASRKIDYVFRPEEYLSIFDQLIKHMEDMEKDLDKAQKQLHSVEKELKSKIRTLEQDLSRHAMKTLGLGTRYK